MKNGIDREWLTLEAATRRLADFGVAGEPGDLLHMAGKGRIRSYMRLKEPIAITATRIDVDPNFIPRRVVCGGGVMMLFVRLTKQAAWTLEAQGSVEIESIIQGDDDPLEEFPDQESGIRWRPTEPLIAQWSDIVVPTSDLDQIAESEQREPVGAADETSSWPWGSHHTLLLGHLRDAGIQWWSTFDPDDPSTAPTKEDVVRWLLQRGVSERPAEYIATILRADGLPHGPRRKRSGGQATD
jgi:hypothetical protein